MTSVYEDRLQRIRKAMDSEGMDAIFLMMSSDLQYLTGVIRQPHNPTDENKHGDELYGSFLTQERGPVFVVPRMGASEYVRRQSEGKPWIEDIVVISDGDDPVAFAKAVLQRMGSPRRLGVSGRLWARSIFRLQQASPGLGFADASLPISRMRAVKDEEETRIMKEAGAMTDQVFGAVLKQMRVGMTEHDLAEEVNHQIIANGGSGMSFHTNVWLKGKGIRPLYCKDGITKNTPIQPGAVIAFDFGIMHHGYASDFGRVVFCGEPTEHYRRYHDMVMKAQAEAISVMKPGNMTAAQLNRVARAVLEEENLAQYFTHRLGHGIGIDVHEPPFLYELDHTVLQAGMCFTVEPSLRVPDEIDVRVEDVVQVTEEGGIPFSRFSHGYLVI